MTFFKFLNRRDNVVEIVQSALSLLKVPATSTGIEEDLLRHPDYPSLLSISDILTSYGIENVSIIASIEQLSQIPLPSIVPLKIGPEENFAVLIDASSEEITYQNPYTLKVEKILTEEFLRIWPTNIVLLLNADDAKGEKDFIVKNKAERNTNLLAALPLAVIPFLAVIACLAMLFIRGPQAILSSLFILTNAIGLILTGLLLWFEVDQFNPFLKEICKAGRKVNCGAVLASPGARFFGISWSAIGFVYFSGATILLLTRGVLDPSVLLTLAWVNTFALPYVLFSIFYQWRVVKNWCPLCLSVQGILLLHVILSILGGWHSLPEVGTNALLSISIPFIFSYAVSGAGLMLVLPAFHKNKIGQKHEKELYKFKHNLQLFEFLLAKQKEHGKINKNMGIVMGSKNPAIRIVKVCNPYCQPCSNAHSSMEDLLVSNPEIQLQIVFAVSPDADIKSKPVKHILAIQEKYGDEAAENALKYWYQKSVKDYQDFEKKYPMNGEVDKQQSKVKEMYDWCQTAEIMYTPTFFINGFKLPEMYHVNDLKYLFVTQ